MEVLGDPRVLGQSNIDCETGCRKFIVGKPLAVREIDHDSIENPHPQLYNAEPAWIESTRTKTIMKFSAQAKPLRRVRSNVFTKG